MTQPQGGRRGGRDGDAAMLLGLTGHSLFTKRETEAQRACPGPPSELAAELKVEPRTAIPILTLVSSPRFCRAQEPKACVCTLMPHSAELQEPAKFGRRGLSQKPSPPTPRPAGYASTDVAPAPPAGSQRAWHELVLQSSRAAGTTALSV